MSKKVKKDKDEEIVEMGEGTDGKYELVAVTKVNPNPPPAQYIHRRLPVFYEFLGGFVMGLEALESFMMNIKRFGNRRRQKNKNEYLD